MLLAVSLCLLVASPSLSAPAGQPQTRARNKLLFISFDGFRWDYDRDVDTPNLDQMALDGVKATYVTPPFLTITSPTHFTLLTGKYIENHGVIHNMWFNTTTQEKKQYYETQFVDDYWDNGSLPIFITAQRQGLKAGSMHFPGTAASYQKETLKVRDVEPRFYDHKNETLWRMKVDKVMKEWFVDMDLDFVTLYFGDPDATGHAHGPDSLERQEAVRKVDRTMGYIRDMARSLGLSERLNIIITADHGMTTVLRDGLVEEIMLSKIPGFSFRDLKFHLVDYGPTGMLLPKDGMLDKVYNALKGGHPHLHVYKREEMPERFHYSKHPRLLPIILYADPGYVINGFYPFQFNKGEHGFDNLAMDMKPFFRAVGPDFHKNLEVGPFETIHIYSLLCHLLGITPEPNDGSLEVTKHLLLSDGTNDSRSPTESVQYRLFLGFAAVAGFLVIVFVIMTTFHAVKRHRARPRSDSSPREPEEKEDLYPFTESLHHSPELYPFTESLHHSPELYPSSESLHYSPELYPSSESLHHSPELYPSSESLHHSPELYPFSESLHHSPELYPFTESLHHSHELYPFSESLHHSPELYPFSESLHHSHELYPFSESLHHSHELYPFSESLHHSPELYPFSESLHHSPELYPFSESFHHSTELCPFFISSCSQLALS
ncbi:ectonucleotide pyrophosphatase/phosphodiesterase family member 7-like [Chanos chanos]|uniref:Ectonucleotide pyrophosphatase/phosphodiesterase family member 7-like n=1 Tax=Chanos chanos TaxID=29144 RepID=A0A6J2VDU8_CHACN|nr:ectonucleotide pyrophosphatase/phosphodiesterase family member 7-like [Chanos chanos]